MYVQYNPSKRASFGVKMYKLCESQTGYCCDFKIYFGDDKVATELLASESVVHLLTQSYLNEGRIIHMDNWYSSLNLYKFL